MLNESTQIVLLIQNTTIQKFSKMCSVLDLSFLIFLLFSKFLPVKIVCDSYVLSIFLLICVYLHKSRTHTNIPTVGIEYPQQNQIHSRKLKTESHTLALKTQSDLKYD